MNRVEKQIDYDTHYQRTGFQHLEKIRRLPDMEHTVGFLYTNYIYDKKYGR